MTSLAINYPRLRPREWMLDQLPPVPDDQVVLVLDRRLVSRRQFWGAFKVLCVVYAGVLLIILGGGTAALISPLYLAALAVHAVCPAISVTVAFFVLYAPLLGRVGRYVNRLGGFRDGLARAAMAEEQRFREGAEAWTVVQKTKSCVIFALAHLWNLYVPLGLLVPMALSGGYFMRVYLQALSQGSSRKQATLDAAATHYAFNILAVGAFGVIVMAMIALTVG